MASWLGSFCVEFACSPCACGEITDFIKFCPFLFILSTVAFVAAAGSTEKCICLRLNLINVLSYCGYSTHSEVLFWSQTKSPNTIHQK